MKKNFLFILLIILFLSCQTGTDISVRTKSRKKLRAEAKELTEKDIDLILKDSELGFYPVTVGGIPDKLFSDIDGDGVDDIVVLYVKSNNPNATEFDSLSKKSRAYNDNVERSQFSLIAFANSGSEIEKKATVLLGSYKVIDSIKRVKGTKNPNSPNLFSVSFYKSDGNITKMISFKNFDIASVFELKENVTSGYYLKDIDKDDIPEIIKYQQTIVRGTSFDTVLSLYKWDGEKYSFKEGKFVVSQLNSFLDSIRSCIKRGDTVSLVKNAFPFLEARKYLNLKLNMKEILKIIFAPADIHAMAIRKPKQVIFADIQENPFQLQNRNKEHSFQIYCRLIFGNLSSDFYKATIVLNDNPFSEKQYYFTY